jgi:hypothetical protein
MCNKCGCKYEEEDGTCIATGNVFDDTWPCDAKCEINYIEEITRAQQTDEK